MEQQNEIDISNLQKAVKEMESAVRSELVPSDYDQLLYRLNAIRDNFPIPYKEAVLEPFITTLSAMGKNKFDEMFQDEGLKNSLLGVAKLVLQKGEGYKAIATDAFQEVVTDLYDGFLSAEDRSGVKPPDLGIIPPLVGWAGVPEDGPFTWPADDTKFLNMQTALVIIPPLHAERGLLAWACLPHEVCGHDILHADIGLKAELADAVNKALAESIGQELAEYWSARIDETASDVLGVLNLGPAAALGFIGFVRGMNGACLNKSQLRNVILEDDPGHPVDILRGYLVAYATGFLEFSQAAKWQKIIEAETDKDLQSIEINGKVIASDIAKQSAQIVAATIMKTKLKSLENHSLDQIQNWRDTDEAITLYLRQLFRGCGLLKEKYKPNLYAAHVVAAAVLESMVTGANVNLYFDRMIYLLKEIHDARPRN